VRAVEQDDNAGFCKHCGAEVYGIEPDARLVPCEVCGQCRVYGAMALLMEMA
jgi:hypothetical protein